MLPYLAAFESKLQITRGLFSGINVPLQKYTGFVLSVSENKV